MRSTKHRQQSILPILPRVLAFALASLLPAPALLCAAPEPAKTPEPIRVLTYNLRLSTTSKDKDGNAWENRRESLADVITKHPDGNGPYDFIGTQETVIHPKPGLNQRDFLASKLPTHGVIGRSREASAERGEGMILYWKKDRWLLDPRENGTFWLSDTPSTPGSKEESAGCPRTAVFGLFHELGASGAPTGRKLYVYDTHLDHISEGARQRGAKILLSHIAARTDKSIPVVLMGDLNCNEKSPTLRYLTGEKVTLDDSPAQPPLALIDTFAAANPGEKQTSTFNGFKAPGNKRIDFILVSPSLKTLSSKIIRTLRPDGGYPSDHFPVETILTWGE